MSIDLERLRRRAKRRAREAERRRQDPRFRRVMGRLVGLGLLETNIPGIRTHRRALRVEDACWAGKTEPRILELLPALVLKKPGVFRDADNLPADLRDVVDAIRHGRQGEPFRGIAAADYQRWIPRLGHRGKYPTLVKSFRLRQADLQLLSELKRELGLRSDVEVLRASLRALRSRC